MIRPASSVQVGRTEVAVSRDARINAIGTVVFVASASMMFAALLFAFSLLRENGELGPMFATPILKPLIATGLVGAAAFAVRRHSGIAVVLSGGFLLVQGLWWRELWTSGVFFAESPRASFLYAITWFHAVHALVGVVGLGRLAVVRQQTGRSWILYWDFVAILWLVIAAVVLVAR